ncbi:MAG TPA: HAD hydrolase-like protein [Acidimicrobiales bacterium]|nr:HAD hydrolase-like protein [Acidimicrobiales bacterium]
MTAPAVLFDLDGCLIDSRAGILASVHVAMSACGLAPMPDAELEWLIGPPLRTGFAELCRRVGRDDASLAQALLDAYRADYHDTMLDHTPLVSGVESLVRALSASRPVGVVTSKPRVLALEILEHHGLVEVFSVVEGPTFDEADEPKVDTLGRALVELDGLTASTMVGDRHHDIEAGRAHGLRTIGVTWGIGSAAELGEAGADTIVSSVDELASELGL